MAVSILQSLDILCLLLTISFAWVILKRRGNPPPNSPPIVHSNIPWLGHALGVVFQREDLLKECRAKYGPVYKVPVAGRYLNVVSSPTAIATVLRKPLKTLRSLNDRAIRDLAGVDEARVPYVAQLVHHKIFGIIATKMSKRTMGSFFVGMTHNLSARLDQVVPDGSPVQISLIDLIRETQFRISAPAFLGPRIPEVYSDFVQLDTGSYYLITGVPFLRRGSYYAVQRMKDALIPYVEEVFNNDHKGIYVEGASIPIMESLNELKKAGLSVTETARVLVSILWGFHSNITHLIINACAFLASNPESCAQVTRHLREVIAKRWTDLDGFLKEEPLILDDPDFAIIDSVLEETLRMSSVASSAREVLEDVTLTEEGGEVYVLRRGEYAITDIAGLHYDPTIFPEPDVFKADRFMNINAYQSDQGVKNFVPWGAGPSSCKGREYAEYIFKMWLIQLLVKYDVSVPTGFSPSLRQNASPTVARLNSYPVVTLRRPTKINV